MGERIRISLPSGQAFDLAAARSAVFSAIWARSQGAEIVSSNENPTALEDLEWLGVEPDAMVSAPKAERYEAAAANLITAGLAYPCYCRASEMREMPPADEAAPEPIRYDGRCRGLSNDDRKALKKGGRTPAIRLVHDPDPVRIPIEAKKPIKGALDHDFLILTAEGDPTPAFALLVNTHHAKASLQMVPADRPEVLIQAALIARALEWPIPRTALLPVLPSLPSGSGILAFDTQAIASLRTAGYLPVALFRFLAGSGWNPEDHPDLGTMAKAFALKDLDKDPTNMDPEDLRKVNGEVLAALPETARVAVVVEHLTRRGYPIVEREPEWQQRFVKAVSEGLRTLADAESLANAILGASVVFDENASRVLRHPDSGPLFQELTSFVKKVNSDRPANWRTALSKFRQKTEAPGRALATLRVAITGDRTGPSLAPIMALMGTETCLDRLDKARRYAES